MTIDDASAVRAREIAGVIEAFLKPRLIAYDCRSTSDERHPIYQLQEEDVPLLVDALTTHGDAIRAATVRETVAKLLEFVEHDEDCDKHYIPTKDCCCGLDALLLSFPSHPDFLPDAPAPTRGEGS